METTSLDERVSLSMSEVVKLRSEVEARMSTQDLVLAEYEADKLNQLELEELNQQTFESVKYEVKQVWENLTMDMGSLKAYATRSVDVLNEAFHQLQKRSEEDRLTAAKKSQLHSTIEGNVMRSVVSALEAQMDRQFETLKLDVKNSLMETERNGVIHRSEVQTISERMHKMQQQMFEVEKSQAKLSMMYPTEEDVGRMVTNGGPGLQAPGHRLSVLDHTVAGLTNRLTELEDKMKQKEGEMVKIADDGVKRMQERADEIVSDVRDLLVQAREQSEAAAEEVKRSMTQMLFEFQTTSRANADEMNKEAIKISSRALQKVEESTTYMRKSLDLNETRIGRVRIDFDRMVGDTTCACEALADSLSSARGEIRGLANRQGTFEKSLIERGGASHFYA